MTAVTNAGLQVNAPTHRIVIILALGYLSIAFLYGILWYIWAEADECGMDIHTLQQVGFRSYLYL